MLYNSLHNKWLRLLTAILGTLVMCCAQAFFIVPLHLYTGGLMGYCQFFRTLLQDFAGLSFGSTDIAGILYFLFNIPILFLSFRYLGRRLTVKTVICVASYTLFYSALPSPETALVDDYLTGCLLGAILNGIGSGLVLTCGCSTGGLDILGLILSKRGSAFTVGRFSIGFNALLYGICLLLFVPEVAIYSVIYNFTSNMVLDRVHQQNVNMQALIFTKEDERTLGHFIMENLHRGVTYWEGTGAYTGSAIHVLCVSLSKYEIEELLHAVHKIDPHAFITVQKGVQIYGNYQRKVE